ncbi:hypothetical protein ACP4OV_015229 [Aristida adscensionis]
MDGQRPSPPEIATGEVDPRPSPPICPPSLPQQYNAPVLPPPRDSPRPPTTASGGRPSGPHGHLFSYLEQQQQQAGVQFEQRLHQESRWLPEEQRQDLGGRPSKPHGHLFRGYLQQQAGVQFEQRLHQECHQEQQRWLPDEQRQDLGGHPTHWLYQHDDHAQAGSFGYHGMDAEQQWQPPGLSSQPNLYQQHDDQYPAQAGFLQVLSEQQQQQQSPAQAGFSGYHGIDVELQRQRQVLSEQQQQEGQEMLARLPHSRQHVQYHAPAMDAKRRRMVLPERRQRQRQERRQKHEQSEEQKQEGLAPQQIHKEVGSFHYPDKDAWAQEQMPQSNRAPSDFSLPAGTTPANDQHQKLLDDNAVVQSRRKVLMGVNFIPLLDYLQDKSVIEPFTLKVGTSPCMDIGNEDHYFQDIDMVENT